MSGRQQVARTLLVLLAHLRLRFELHGWKSAVAGAAAAAKLIHRWNPINH